MRELERTRRRKGRRRGWRSFAPRGVMRKFEISRPSPASCHQPKKYNTAASHKRLIQTPCHLSTTPLCCHAGDYKDGWCKVFLPFLPPYNAPALGVQPGNRDSTYTFTVLCLRPPIDLLPRIDRQKFLGRVCSCTNIGSKGHRMV